MKKKMLWCFLTVLFISGTFLCIYSGFLEKEQAQEKIAVLGVIFIVLSIALIFVIAACSTNFEKN